MSPRNFFAELKRRCSARSDVRSTTERSTLSENSVRKSSHEPARFRSAIDSNGRTIWIADAHSGDRKRFVVQADEKLTAPVGGRIFLTLIHNGDV